PVLSMIFYYTGIRAVCKEKIRPPPRRALFSPKIAHPGGFVLFKRRFGDFAAGGKVTRAGARNTSILAPEGETLLATVPQRKRSFAALRMILAPRRSFVDSTAKVW
ncbi:MAG: hypothetical protein II094_02190, partial [Oscillospiraceae bacterium]|nr:hypothetical protein [Oscillospiraceae bacterium]